MRKIGPVGQRPDHAYNILKDAIISLKLMPGEPLVESELSEKLGVSKTPIRDALLRLEQEGFVDRIPFKGAFVSKITINDVKEIFEIRLALEVIAVRSAARLFTDEQIVKAKELLQTGESSLQSEDYLSCSRAITEFHNLFIEVVPNSRIQDILLNLKDHLHRIRNVSAHIPGRFEKTIEDHRRILQAVEQKNEDLAEELIKDHISSLLGDYAHGKQGAILSDGGIGDF